MDSTKNIDTLSANSIRVLSLDIIDKANSGHPGLPLGAADYVYILWRKYLKFNPENPNWLNRDRFILSAGHGSALLYSMLHISGYNLSIDDLKNFRQWGSKTPGHPEYGETEGVETSTGPLGQGFSNAVGMAIAEKMLQARLNSKIINHKIYALAGDGDLMEGISYESASIAGKLGLDNLIVFYDDNNITIDGTTEISFNENIEMRFKAQNWDIIKIDGHNFKEIEKALDWAQNENGKPKLIIAKTTIGKGCPNKSNTPKIHGSPAGPEETKLVKQNFGFDPDKSFFIPQEVYDNFKTRISELKQIYAKWENEFNSALENDKNFKDTYNKLFNPELKPDILNKLYDIFKNEESIATRNASNKILQELAEFDERLISGSADLFGSVKNYLSNYDLISKDNFSGRNIQFGIREHAMGGIINGITLYKGFRPIASTFYVFSDYMKPAIRLSALMKIPALFVFSHDSIFVGEDGPTHQPVEQNIMLRSIPGLILLKPADAIETAAAYYFALTYENGPVVITLTRQNLPVFDRNRYSLPDVNKGAYIIKKESKENPDLIIISTGSEVSISLIAAEKLESEGFSVRVVSMMSTELFDKQSEEYKQSILGDAETKRLIVEAGSTIGWYKYAGCNGKIIGIDKFGASAPYKILAERYNINEDFVYSQASDMLK